MTLVNLLEGEMFGGKYKVLRCFATGGMGAVYEVVHINTNCHHALKVMKPEFVNKDDLRERFKREAKVPAIIKSKYVVKVDDAGVDEKTQMLFLVMELLQGEDLGKRLKHQKRFQFNEAVNYLWQTAKALDKAHKVNIVHRDLKPDNLFLCEDDEGLAQIKVLDFGIAKFMAEGGQQANMTQAVGTPLYMAPEQSLLGSGVSPATDIYALGMMAYTLLVGVPYWNDEQQQAHHFGAFFMATMQGPQEAPTERAKREGVVLPSEFNSWFQGATAREQERRFQSASEAVQNLARVLGVPETMYSMWQRTESTGVHALGSLIQQPQPGQTYPGQTTPAPSSSGKTWPSRTGSEVQTGTVVLEECASTSGNGFGLVSSQPRMSVRASGLVRTQPSESQAMPKPQKGRGVLVVIAFAACAMSIGAAVGFSRNAKPKIEPLALAITTTSAPSTGDSKATTEIRGAPPPASSTSTILASPSAALSTPEPSPSAFAPDAGVDAGRHGNGPDNKGRVKPTTKSNTPGEPPIGF